MIPFAALACLVETQDGKVREVSVQDVSALGVTFRVPADWTGAIRAGVRQVTLRAHRFSGDEACTIAAGGFELLPEEETDETSLWRVETADAACRALLRTFMEAYAQYAELKAAGDDARLAQVLTGYPAEHEAATAATFAAQRESWLAGCVPDADWLAAALAVPELAAPLTDEDAQEAFLTLSPAAFTAWYWRTRGMAGHALAARPFDCVYIGSQYCAHLLPERALLHRLLERCEVLRVRPVLALAPVTEGRLDETLSLLAYLAQHKETQDPLELVINDWGLPQLLPDRAAFTLTMGVLLNKRRKDVRLPYMQGFGGREALLRQNAANAPGYRDWLTAQGFTRLSVEACGQDVDAQQGPFALHLPFYQMNTASRCTLAARCETGDRGRQAIHTDCPRWCRERAFLYPDALCMAGRYNTLFGLDRRSMTDGAYLRSLTAYADRLVIDLL